MTRLAVLVLLATALCLSCTNAAIYNIHPQFVRTAVTGDGQSFSVSWSTISKLTEAQAVVHYGSSPSSLKSVASADSTSYLPEGISSDPTLVYWHHHALLTQLQPSTTYYFGIPPANKIYQFKTQPPTPTNGNPANVTFVSYGDMGVMNGANTFLRMLEVVNSKAADLVFHVGDISYADDYTGDKYETVWNTYMGLMTPITSAIPYMVAPGNHEFSCEHQGCNYSQDFAAYRARFAGMPANQSGSSTPIWYSFDYGGIHFVAISTESDFPGAPEAPTLFGNQLAWLKADLQKANQNRQNVPWIIVGGHRPIYASSVGYSVNGKPVQQTLALQQAVEGMFRQNKVDLFIVGHVHSYERTWPVYNSQLTAKNYNNPTAPVHVIVGCAGNEEGLNPDNQWTQQAPWSATRYNKDWGYLKVSTVRTASQDTLTYNFHTSSDNAIRDTITIVKTRS